MTQHSEPPVEPQPAYEASPDYPATEFFAALGTSARGEARQSKTRPSRAALATIGVLALALVLFLAAGLTGRWGVGEPAGLAFVIPAGAKERIARPGYDTAIDIPIAITFGPGEAAVITIRNLDDVTHRAGPFVVGAGQTYVQRFPEPGRYPIACTVDPLESVVVTVEV